MDKARFDALVQDFRELNEAYLGPANRAESIADYVGRDFGESYRRKGDWNWRVHGRSRRMKLKWDRQIEDSETSADDWDAISLVAQQLLRDHKPLPEVLADWVADVVEDVPKKRDDKKRARPTKRGAKQKNYTRDENIRFWIYFARKTTDPPINPTRNKERAGKEPAGEESCVEGGSLCDVVGVALGMKYATVEKIWTNRRTHLGY